jgi:DNA-binding NarL/FixJ family response regulator
MWVRGEDDPDFSTDQVRPAFSRHRVNTAGTACEGLHRVRAEPSDVILLNLRLPDQSGQEVYKQICELDAGISRAIDRLRFDDRQLLRSAKDARFGPLLHR